MAQIAGGFAAIIRDIRVIRGQEAWGGSSGSGRAALDDSWFHRSANWPPVTSSWGAWICVASQAGDWLPGVRPNRPVPTAPPRKTPVVAFFLSRSGWFLRM
jgi:hypothetical protein